MGDGEEAIIARPGTPIARIWAVAPRTRSSEAPLLPGIPPMAVDALFSELAEVDIIDGEEGRSADPLRQVEAP